MKRIVIGIIGAGRIGKLHLNNLKKNSNIIIKTIADTDAKQLQELKQLENTDMYNFTDNPDTIFEDPEISTVFIFSSTSSHVELIKKAAKSTKHIFCEKPISFNHQESIDANKEVERAGVKFQLGFNRRFDKNFMEMKNRIMDNKVGDVHLLKITSRDPEPPHPDYIESSGGLFYDMSIHDFDLARHLVGSEIIEVFAYGANLVEPYIGKKGDVDTAIISLKFKNGALGIIDNSREAVYGYDQRIEVFGNKGALIANNETYTNLEYYSSSAVETDRPLHFFLERYNEAFASEIQYFVESIINNNETKIKFNDGVIAQKIAQATTESHMAGKPIKI